MAAMVIALLSAGCSTHRNAAPVIEHGAQSRRGNMEQTAVTAASRESNVPGYYIVKKGDTLNQIAAQFNQDPRDLARWNNLANPNDIKVNQALRVKSAEAMLHTASPVQVSDVQSDNAGIEVRPLNAPAVPNAEAVVSMHKTSPLGVKRPYSENTLAELQKTDAPAVVAASGKNNPSANNEKTIEMRSVANSDDANVSWVWPVEGKIINDFEKSRKGLDIAGTNGQKVGAAAAGKVMYAGSGIRGYGQLVIIKHTSNLLSAYAYNKTILVKEGQAVSKGQQIAEMGNSDSDSTKLHFEIRQQGKPVDPKRFLPAR